MSYFIPEICSSIRKSSIVETSHRNSDVLDICHTDHAICDGYELHSNTRTTCTINTGYKQVNFVEKREVEKGITLEHLSKNLNQIREDGFSKLSRLVKNLNSEGIYQVHLNFYERFPQYLIFCLFLLSREQFRL
jgi:hypothetical protein